MMSLRSAVSRVSRSAIQRRTLADKGKNVTAASSDAVEEKPLYATRASFDQRSRQQRLQSSDSESGHRPSAMQKRFLVITKLYEKKEDIPEFVQHGTMNRMHDRMRVVFIVVAICIFFSIHFTFEKFTSAKINRDRAAGKSIDKM